MTPTPAKHHDFPSTGYPGSLIGHGPATARTSSATSADYLSRLIESAVDGAWDWDLHHDLVHFCARWKSTLGIPDDVTTVTPEQWFERVHPDDVAAFRESIQKHLDGYSDRCEHEHRVILPDGSVRWVLGRGRSLVDGAGRRRFVGLLTDVTMRKEAELRILHAVYHDNLTGLPNRAYFTQRLQEAIARRARKATYRFAVLFIDLDRFKPINDRYGHLAGDRMLVEVGRRLQACIRPGDMVARLAGDEFTVLVDDVHDARDAVRVAERIQSSLRRPVRIAGVEVTSGASIGIALSDCAERKTVEDFLRDADAAMYRAKGTRSSRYAVFEPSEQHRAASELEMEDALQQAVNRGELCIHYQPIVCLDSEALCGLEALLRWRHPSRGIIPPGEFLPVAEATGAIVPIGHWMVREALRQIKTWRAQGTLDPAVPVSLNFSRRQLLDPSFADEIRAALEETGVTPCSLRIELPASALVPMDDQLSRSLREIGELGVQLSIDDFGTGHTSLGQLDQLPVDTLKIDRSFVNAMSPEGGCEKVVRSIIAIARNLGINVIAKGVENAWQRTRLKNLDCSFGQGRYFYGPLTSDEVPSLLSSLCTGGPGQLVEELASLAMA